MSPRNGNIHRRNRWYFGGLGSMGATCFTHPLDVIKVNLQTEQNKLTPIKWTRNVIREQGVSQLYRGLSASLMRQLTYSTARFGLYDIGKSHINIDSFSGRITLAGFTGMFGGFIGTPADMINVRMQNDVKLTPEARRNYKNVFDGLLRVYKYEGISGLFSGATIASSRGLLVTIGQIAFYDQVKTMLLQTTYFEEDLRTFFTASLIAAVMATTLTQPLDVVKTRFMNAKPDEYMGLLDVVKHTARLGTAGFFKGYTPAFARIAPHTVITFILIENLRLNFGILLEE